MEEYSDALGDTKLKGNQFYENHLKALEMRRVEEEQDSKELKVKIMHQANLMQYDDDFDEEADQLNKKQKYRVGVVDQQQQQQRKPAQRQTLMDEIQPIQSKNPHLTELV